MGKNLWLRAKTETNLKPKFKMKVVWNTCDKELRWNDFFSMKTTSKVHLKTSKSHSLFFPFREIYVKYLEKNSI